MSDAAARQGPGTSCTSPTVLGAVVVDLQRARCHGELKLTRAVLADIFLGKITKWNDPAIAKVEPGHQAPRHGHHGGPPLRRLGHDLRLHRLPDARSRRSGRRRSAAARASRWPVGLGGKGNEGVTGLVKQTPGLDRLRGARLRDPEQAAGTRRCRTRTGNFVAPSLAVHLGGRRRRDAPRRLPRVDHRRPGQGRLPDRLLHLPARPPGREGQGEGGGDGQVPLVGGPRRPGLRDAARLRAASRSRREERREDHPGAARAGQAGPRLRPSATSPPLARDPTPARFANLGDRAWGSGLTDPGRDDPRRRRD